MLAAKASVKFFLFVVLCLITVPPQIIVLLLHKGRYAYFIPQIFHKGVCLIFRIKVQIEGVVPRDIQQTIFVSNHLSYLDIPVIGSVLRASFVAKEDVSGWPVFGFLSNMQQTAFISRQRNKAGDVQGNLDALLKDGKSLILFPEGTSTDGQSVFPFKSSLFSIAVGHSQPHLNIVPFTINMIRVDGRPVLAQEDRDTYAWHLKMDTPLEKHLWHFAKTDGAIIRLVFSPSILPNSHGDRKELAKACQEAVSNGLISVITQTQETAL